MPLEILLAMVVAGISLLAALLHLSGRSRIRALSQDDARAEWHRHFPDDSIRDVIVAQNARSALVLMDGQRGILWAFGADTVGRHLKDFDLTEKPDGLRIDFHDFATPGVSLTLTPTECERWKSLISAPFHAQSSAQSIRQIS